MTRGVASAMVMNSQPLKDEIRRRPFAARRAVGKPTGSRADHFGTCPRCGGRGTVCIEWTQDDRPVASIESCPLCHGDGFAAEGAT